LTQSQELNVFGGGISLQILPPENVRWLLNDWHVEREIFKLQMDNGVTLDQPG